MKFKVLALSFTIGFVIFTAQSCSTTKFVPEGEYLLADATVKSDTKAVSDMEMENYIHQKPNYKTFMLFKLPLSIYNMSGRDSTKWVNRTLRKAGEPPVIFDSTTIEKSKNDLERIMVNKGFLNAEVDPIIKYKGKKANVTYKIESKEPYKISRYSIEVPDSVIDSSIIPIRKLHNRTFSLSTDSVLALRTLISKGDMFDLSQLDAERDRISTIFRRTGYYGFDKEYIGFVADTTIGNHKVDLELVVYPFAQKLPNGQIIEIKHRRYTVDKVSIFVDYNPLVTENVAEFVPSSVYESGNYKILYGERGRFIRPKAILDNCFIEPGKLYDENKTTQTYNALSKLNILKNINISYQLADLDSLKLDCIITCVPDKKQGFSAELEGTNSGGFFGVESSLGYQHRNIFKGSELFSVKARGAYEALSSSFGSFDNNYFEIGGETSLSFPRFMVPFLNDNFKRSVHASTEFTANYTYQRRPEFFTRTILGVGMKYVWQSKRLSAPRHTIDLIDISYVHIPNLSEDFKSSLTENAKRYSFSDQFIMALGYTYSKSNLNPQSKIYGKPISSIRASAESAGNLLALVAKIRDVKKDADGSRKIFGTRYSQYLRGTIDFSQTMQLDEKNSIAWHIGGGIAYPYGNIKEIPIQKRFYSGGANSVRGWAVRELGPGSFYPSDKKKYDNFYYHSGDIRLDANIEYRSKVFWVMELAAFIDAGNIWTIREYQNQENGEFKFNRFYKEIAMAWGLGVRLDFDFVLIRLDCGWKAYDPAKRPDQSSSDRWRIKNPFDIGHNTAWHIAVGYPF